jgi:hypothetical protein
MAKNNSHIEFQIIDNTTYDVTGTLDVNAISNFPIALTYSIKDVQDPSSSKGSFSKTFQIPATGNNNKILKNLYSDSLYDSFQYIEDKDVRIFVDGALVFQGKFQMKGTTYNGIPQHYDCVVYGDNFRWVNKLSELNLCDIDFTASTLFPFAPTTVAQNRDDIIETWNFSEAGQTLTIGGVPKQTHIVFPLVNTGKWNYVDDTGIYDKPIVTPSDMFPAFYLYNMIQCIFNAQGYTIVSDFFNQEWFKRLTTLLPMPLTPNSPTTIASYSFEIENNSTGDWKEPLNYTDITGTGACPSGNTFDGAVLDSTVINDPSSLITLNSSHTPNLINTQSPSGLDTMPSTSPATLAGWYFGAYGIGNGSTSPRIPQKHTNQCTGEIINYGMNWDCIPCDLQGGTTTTYSEPLNADIFSTNFYGTYEFGGRVNVEMDNAYAKSDAVNAFDPINGQDGMYQAGTGEGGAPFDCEYNVGIYPTGAQVNKGVKYVANLYLMHYKKSTDQTHAVLVDSKRRTRNPSFTMWGQNWCDATQLPATPNLTFELDFSGVQLDVLDDEDLIYLYAEVTCEMSKWDTPFNWYPDESIRGLCQMKYRITRSNWRGNLSPIKIEGGSSSLGELLPCNTTQLDYVNGLTGLFNLMWQTNEVNKTVTVEPRDTFFLSLPQSVDWTNKLDKSQDEQGEYIYDTLKRNLCFSYIGDSNDGFVAERNILRGQQCELGSKSLNLGELYTNEEQQIGSYFYAPTYMFYDKSISTNQNAYRQPFIPVLHSEYSLIWNTNPTEAPTSFPEKLTTWTPRLLTWYGQRALNQEDGVDNDNAWKWGYNNNTAQYDELTKYPFAGVYSDQDGTMGGSVVVGGQTYPNPSLYFENSEVSAVSTPTPYDINTGLYEMFWEFNILSLLDRPKIKKAYFKLTSKDIAELDFRKLIFIENAQSDTYWILNKVVDFKCLKRDLTLVELFEYHNAKPLKSRFPTLPTGFGNTETEQWTDYVEVMVNDNKAKINQKQLTTQLQVFKQTRTPVIIQGTQARSLPNKVLVGNYKAYTEDGSRAPMGALIQQGANMGNNHNINTGAITIGNNLKARNGGGIIIGNHNNPLHKHPIQLAQGGKTAMCVSADGIFMEGGGGVIFFQDPTTGDFREVMTGIPQEYDPITGVQQIFYTRCVKDTDDI